MTFSSLSGLISMPENSTRTNLMTPLLSFGSLPPNGTFVSPSAKQPPAPVPLQFVGALPLNTIPPMSPELRLPGAWSLVMMIGQSDRPGALILDPLRKTSTEGEPLLELFLPLITVPGLMVSVTPAATKTVPSRVMSAGAFSAGQQTSPPPVQVWLLFTVPLTTVPRAMAGPCP